MFESSWKIETIYKSLFTIFIFSEEKIESFEELLSSNLSGGTLVCHKAGEKDLTAKVSFYFELGRRDKNHFQIKKGNRLMISGEEIGIKPDGEVAFTLL